MVSNFTNINKVNNYLSPKESLNSDGQQFHQYQQREQSPLTFTHWSQKKTTTYDAGNPYPDLGQAHKCGGVKLVTNLPLFLTGYQTAIHIYIYKT